MVDIEPDKIPDVNKAQRDLQKGRSGKLEKGLPNWAKDGNAMKRKRTADQNKNKSG